MSAADKDVVVDEPKTVPNYLEMSDEEIMKMPPPEPVAADAAAVVTADAVPPTKPAADGDKAGAEDEPEAAGAAQAAEAKADAKDEATDEDKPEAKPDPKAEAKDPVEAKVAEKTEEKPEATKVDYEAEYNRLLKPFKANGRDIQVESVDDAIALMQMGANYNKKMAALKPNLKLMKMLENNGFLSEDKIGFLIDLGKKDPAAINKLVKDSGIDPMDLSAEKGESYKQTAYAVDDREMELDTVLDELQGSPTYTKTLEVVSNKWDVASKRVISEAPQLLKVINDHIASGIYDLISTEVEKGRMLGRLSGLSDIEAYRQVGDAIQARGGFNHLNKVAKPTSTEPIVVTPKPKKVEDDKLKDKRRAASSTQPAAPSAKPADFNPLAMSDDEFSKLANPRYR